MVFGFIDEAINTTAKIVEDAVDVGSSVVTMGEYGELSKENVSRLIASGITLYTLSEATGLAIDVLQSVLDE